MRGEKQPLYRKVNWTAHIARHGTDSGKSSASERNTKAARENESGRGSMHSRRRNGLDYTPLFKFLLSRVGADWVATHREALSRIDREEPITWMVAENKDSASPYFRYGESSYFSSLFVDGDGKLAIVDPTVTKDSLTPYCSCCTHTFNGHPFSRKFEPRV